MTKGNGKKSWTATPREPSWFDVLVVSMFRQALPVWERYESKVPARELRELERAGDWPRGLAAVIIKRLTRDDELRSWIHKLVLKRTEETKTIDEPTA